MYKALPITTLTLPHGLSYATMGTLLGEANSDYYMQPPVPCPKLYYWAITPKHTVSHLYQTGYSYTAKQHRYLRELRLILYRLSNFTYLHSLFLYYPYTHNTMQYNEYKQAGHTSAMRYSHARGLTAYSYTIQC